MTSLPANDARAIAVTAAIQSGDVDALRRWLVEHSNLADTRIIDGHGTARTLVHVVADWPGHFPNGARTVALLVEAGADVNASVAHQSAEAHRETPLHWAASSDDVEVLDALLDCGADIEAPGAVFTGGAPMSDAVVFANWRAARRLLERGAKTTLGQAAALGLLTRVEECCKTSPGPSPQEITGAFWSACRGGQQETAAYLLARGGDLNWVGWGDKTPLDAARESGNETLIAWLSSQF
jgi:ankyrin repeat protein